VKPDRITVAFSSHRPETLPIAAEWMRRHDVVVLEEPPNEIFEGMIRGRVSIEDYLLTTDFEFPLFARRSCGLQRTLHAEGKTILQVDPFMERLSEIHDRFAEGCAPAQVEADRRHGEVYRAERRWTAALLRYYETAVRDEFDVVVAALQAFTRADAARGTLRDRLRAEALVRLLPPDRSVYVEAGGIHLRLVGELNSRLDPARSLVSLHLMEPVLKRLSGKRRYPGPGDKLTLLFTMRPEYRGPLADLLAARALVHVKILRKDEIDGEDGLFPHTRDEIECNRLVDDLSYEECGRLFERIRSLSITQARAVVTAHRGTVD
jgi:hypothetical protein